MKRQFLVAGMLVALGPLAGIGMAAQYGQSSNTNNTKNVNPSNERANTLSSSDRSFVNEAAQGNMAEIKLGELAEKNGGTQQVKEFGKRMVTDHSRLGDTLKSDASKENIQLPSAMNSKDQATYDRLSKLSGTAFDRAYSKDMVNDHQKDISAFQKEAKNGQNTTIKDFAANSTPVLQEHLNLARQMENGASQSSANSTSKKNNPS